jgi:hypothetical protein
MTVTGGDVAVNTAAAGSLSLSGGSVTVIAASVATATGNTVAVLGGEATGTNPTAGAVTIRGGTTSTTGTGGSVTILGWGATDATKPLAGGNVVLLSGTGSSVPGSITLASPGGAGQVVIMDGASAVLTSTGNTATISNLAVTATASLGGGLAVTSGTTTLSGAVDHSGGAVALAPGSGNAFTAATTGAGGITLSSAGAPLQLLGSTDNDDPILIRGGDRTASGTSGHVSILGGSASDASGVGGSVVISGGTSGGVRGGVSLLAGAGLGAVTIYDAATSTQLLAAGEGRVAVNKIVPSILDITSGVLTGNILRMSGSTVISLGNTVFGCAFDPSAVTRPVVTLWDDAATPISACTDTYPAVMLSGANASYPYMLSAATTVTQAFVAFVNTVNTEKWYLGRIAGATSLSATPSLTELIGMQEGYTYLLYVDATIAAPDGPLITSLLRVSSTSDFT